MAGISAVQKQNC